MDIISYLIIKKVEDVHEKEPSGVYFNKAISLFNHCYGRKFSITIPHCWYRWGDEVVRSCLSYNVIWDHQEKTTVRWDGHRPTNVDPSLEKAIESIIREYTPDRAGLKEMVKKVYSYAPYDFQRTFLELRETIDDIITLNSGLEGIFLKVIKNLKKNAIRQYKDERICDHDSFNVWNELFDRVLEIPDYSLLKNINETYWYEFCYHLRIKENENVPRSILEYWKDNLDYDTKNMYNQLIDYARAINEKGVYLSSEILERIREREKERKRIDTLLNELYDGKEKIEIDRKYSYRSNKLM